jgi:hypothetical protein
VTKDDFVLAQRVTLSAALLTGLLSIEACQISVPTTQKETVSTLSKRASGSPDKVIAPVEGAMSIASVLYVQKEPLQQLSLKGRLSEKHFVIPVARSGDFVPDDLGEYVLSIIEQSRQWDYVSGLQIHGHTDSEGAELSNMLLAIRRANFVAERFEELGVEAGLLLIEAHGETQAIADNTTLDGRIANRRIEVVLIGHVGKEADE